MAEFGVQSTGTRVKPASRTADEQLAVIMEGRNGPPVANFTVLRDEGNYGQRLQAYALQRYFMDEFGRVLVTMAVDPFYAGAESRDEKFFHRFERECMNIVDFRGAPDGFIDKFSHIVVGGDQVFRAEHLYASTALRAVPVTARRNVFSYGAGASPVNHVLHSLCRRLDRNILVHGLREDYRVGVGVDYCKTIDPVFLLYDKWAGIERGGHYSGGVFTYYPGRGGSSVSRTVSDGTYVCNVRKSGVDAVDPRDFIGLIHGADAIVTSSFHGVCFALMYRVPRIRITRVDHRIRNLIGMLNIRFEDDRVINYDEVFERIAAEVSRARDFIGMCLSSRPVDYCCYSSDKSVRDASSSGGAAFELARAVFARGGSVYGGAFSDDFRRVVPVCVRSESEYLERLSKSKYSFCPLPDISELKRELNSGHEVMYVGSPCHVHALRRLLGNVPDNLILVDFRCRGYAKPDKLARLIDSVSSGDAKQVVSVDFRPNHEYRVVVKFKDGSSSVSRITDFLSDCLPMCKRCRFGHGLLSCADITVGDFWLNRGNVRGYGDEFTPERGCNIVSVNSARGAELWYRAAGRMHVKPVLGNVE